MAPAEEGVPVTSEERVSSCGHPVDEGDDTGFCARPLGHPYFDQDGFGCSLDADPAAVEDDDE